MVRSSALFFAPVGLIVASAIAAGCAASRATEPSTAVFLLSDVTLPAADASGRAVGIDLDGTNSDGSDASTCATRRADDASLYDSEERGIDNAWGALLGMSMTPSAAAAVREEIADGTLAVAFRVSAIDSLDTDDTVSVELGVARVPGCVATSPASCAPRMDGGELTAWQSVVFVPMGAPVTMQIVEGRLRGALGAFALPVLVFNLTGAEFDVALHGAQIDAAIGDDELHGALGGAVRIDELAASAAMLPDGDTGAIRDALQPYADLEPSASDRSICDAVSVGFAFASVRVSAE